jgi:hypothetical protein
VRSNVRAAMFVWCLRGGNVSRVSDRFNGECQATKFKRVEALT